MSKTVKRVLWQRTLETAGPLRKALPVAPAPASRGFVERLFVNVRFDASAVEAQLAQWRRVLGHAEERGYRQAKRMPFFGMDFAQGGVRDQTCVCLVGERGPELAINITVDARPLEAALAQWQRDLERAKHDLQTGGTSFGRAMQAMHIGVQTASKTMAHILVKQMVGEINEASGEA